MDLALSPIMILHPIRSESLVWFLELGGKEKIVFLGYIRTCIHWVASIPCLGVGLVVHPILAASGRCSQSQGLHIAWAYYQETGKNLEQHRRFSWNIESRRLLA